jgi:hypothetical protein
MNKETTPRGRSGGRKPKYSADTKPIQANFKLPAGELAAFCELVPEPAYRNQLIAQWIRAYTIANGESNRLLAQSPTLAKNIAYLEANDGPQDLIDDSAH